MSHCSIQGMTWLIARGCSLSGVLVMGVADLRPHPFPLPLQAQAKSDDEAYDQASEEAATKKKKKKRDPPNIILLKQFNMASLIGKVWLRFPHFSSHISLPLSPFLTPLPPDVVSW